MLEPRKRSLIRLKLGEVYFTIRRYVDWHFSRTCYANKKWDDSIDQSPFTYLAFTHSSVLLRQLNNVEMWLQFNKIHNLKLAIPSLNGLLLCPGETMSYWKLVGRPSKRKGYLKGMELVGGNFRAAYGGGLCQLSNLIYWMTLHTPLTVIERYRHQYDVFPDSNRTQPFGSGATCSYNYIDLQVRNDTYQTFCLHLYMNETQLVGEWRSNHPLTETYKVYEKNHRFTQEFWGGYVRHNEIWRKVYNPAGVLLVDEFVTENHAIMSYPPLLKEG